jgi:DNA mismatch repair protein MutS
LKVHYDPKTDRLIYDRHLEEGSGSSYYGLEVAKAMNIPMEFLEMAHSIRKEILQEKETVSSYNKECIVKSCELCGSKIHNTLEVHHIQQQKEADENGFLKDGTHKDHIRNLIVLCETCHKKQHYGILKIQSLKATSEGTMIDTNETKETKGPKYHEHQDIIVQYIEKYPKLTPKRLCFELEIKEEIQVSEQVIRKLRKLVSG